MSYRTMRGFVHGLPVFLAATLSACICAPVPQFVGFEKLGLYEPTMESFGSAGNRAAIGSHAIAANGTRLYIGRSFSRDQAQRNLTVATLNATTGAIVGIPRTYVSSGQALSPAGSLGQITVSSIVIDQAKRRLYMGMSSGAPISSKMLSIYALDANGDPTGAVMDYECGNDIYPDVQCVVRHPTLAKLYISGFGLTGVTVYTLDASGDPTMPTPDKYDFGGYGKYTISISSNGLHLYAGTYSDVVEVVDLDASGNPLVSTYRKFTISNPAVGTVPDYARFATGAKALYMVRPDPANAANPPVLAVWPLSTSTGDPTGAVQVRTDIHPALIGADVLTIVPDNTNGKLWVTAVTTFTDAFSATAAIEGFQPMSYSISTTGTLGTIATLGTAQPARGGIAVAVPTANCQTPVFFSHPIDGFRGNRVSGYKCQITITAAALNGGGTPMWVNGNLDMGIGKSGWGPIVGPLMLNVPSDWISLDGVLRDKHSLEAFSYRSNDDISTMTVKVVVQNSASSTLKTLVESVSGNLMGFVLPTYGMTTAELGGTAMKTLSTRASDYLATATASGVAAADRATQLKLNGVILYGREGNTTLLTRYAQTFQQLGLNTCNAYNFPGIAPATIDSTLTSNGLPNRSTAAFNGPLSASKFAFSPLVTSAALSDWASELITQVANDNGGSPSQVVEVVMADEPVWYYPSEEDELIAGTSGSVTSFQDYLTAKGFTLADFGASSWTEVITKQSVGNPIGGTASLNDRKRYFWTRRFFTDSAVDLMRLHRQALIDAFGQPLFTTVNWNNFVNRWFKPHPNVIIPNNPDGGPDASDGSMDWMKVGRDDAHTPWTEDWFDDRDANTWSVWAAMLRSSSQSGSLPFGAYVVGRTLKDHLSGGKYKVFPLLGNGAKTINYWTWGPQTGGVGNGWSETPQTYKLIADANRLAGRADSLLYNGVAERGKVAILLPNSSALWDQEFDERGYAQDMYGLYVALSHGLGMPVDFVDDIDIINGVLTSRDYWVLYVTGPNVMAAAQTAISTWIGDFSHSRTLAVLPGAGTADEYNTATTTFEDLLGLTTGTGQRTAIRTSPHAISIGDLMNSPYTNAVKLIDTTFNFMNQVYPIRGDSQTMTLASGSSATTDAEYFPGNAKAMTTKTTTFGAIKNRAIAYGFFPGYQYQSSPYRRFVDHLPQGWSTMARELAIMPVLRTEPPRTSYLSGNLGPGGTALTETNIFLNAANVEVLRLNSPGGVAVVLINWSDIPIPTLHLRVPGSSYSSVTSATGSAVTKFYDGTSMQLDFPLANVDVIMMTP